MRRTIPMRILNKRQLIIPVELYSIKSIKKLNGISLYDILFNLFENLR
ncbi:hypothetical protein BALOs_1531 [Halobacteriovorax sp. BALOs_7]|nr:hypothetical protein BALOs_1531 [Halobacteriovorax sp. BALOs_7]